MSITPRGDAFMVLLRIEYEILRDEWQLEAKQLQHSLDTYNWSAVHEQEMQWRVQTARQESETFRKGAEEYGSIPESETKPKKIYEGIMCPIVY
jgi:hypothetical protein